MQPNISHEQQSSYNWAGLLTLVVGWKERHRAYKNWVLSMLVVVVVIWVELDVLKSCIFHHHHHHHHRIRLLCSKLQLTWHSGTSWPGVPWKWAVKFVVSCYEIPKWEFQVDHYAAWTVFRWLMEHFPVWLCSFSNSIAPSTL